MAIDTALPKITFLSPLIANVCRMVRVDAAGHGYALRGAFFFHFERTPDAPTWLLSMASFHPTGGKTISLTAPCVWRTVTEQGADDAVLLSHAREMYPWLPALVDHVRPTF